MGRRRPNCGPPPGPPRSGPRPPGPPCPSGGGRDWSLGQTLLAALVVLAVAFGVVRRSAGADQPLPPLRWAADAEGGAPYIFRDPARPDRHIGFEVDLIEALEEELGRPIEFVQYDFKSLVSGLRRGDFDFAMNGLEVTPDRARQLRFSRPYYVYRLRLVVRRDETRFDTLLGCRDAGGVVATLEDTAAERLLDQLGIAKRIYDSQAEPYSDLEQGQVDAVLLDLPIAEYYARHRPRLRYAEEPEVRGYYAIAFRPEQEELARQFDAAIARLWSTGRLRHIYEKWGLWNEDQAILGTLGPAGDVLGDSARKWTPAQYLPLLLQGAWVTIEVSVLSMMAAMALGLPIALARLYGPAPLRWLAAAYVEFFRGIPVLLLLYFLYYGLPTLSEYYRLSVDLKLAPLQAAILGFGLNYAAYEAEIYRAGIGSIGRGQWEAAASLGMSRSLAFRRIILPQAVRVIIPPVTNDFIALLKDTSLVSVIAVVELTKQYQILAKSSMKYLEIGLATAALYLAMSVPLGYLSRRLEKRWGKGT